MLMAWVWTGMLVISVLFALLTGRVELLAAASINGAKAAFELCLSIGGLLCLWSGVMEVMRRSGLSETLSGLLRPLLRKLFPISSRDDETCSALAQNISANLLGLGNAATPAGIRAVQGMRRLSERAEVGDEICRLVVLNTASVQLLPTTIAAVRASGGASNAFDILPAVWLSSLISVFVGLLAARVLERVIK